jgi:hypothetical protein
MKFKDIIDELLEGRLFRHKDLEGGYIYLYHGEDGWDDRRLYIYDPHTQKLERYNPTKSDLLRDDWVPIRWKYCELLTEGLFDGRKFQRGDDQRYHFYLEYNPKYAGGRTLVIYDTETRTSEPYMFTDEDKEWRDWREVV